MTVATDGYRTYSLPCPHCGVEHKVVLNREVHGNLVKRIDSQPWGVRLIGPRYCCASCGKQVQEHKALSIYGVVSMAVGDPDRPNSDATLRYPNEFEEPPETLQDDLIADHWVRVASKWQLKSESAGKRVAIDVNVPTTYLEPPYVVTSKRQAMNVLDWAEANGCYVERNIDGRMYFIRLQSRN